MTDNPPNANRQILRAAGIVMVAFIISNLAGLLRQILAANAFGTQSNMEAFNAANRVSETIFNLAAGGALSSAFIPTFTGLLTQKNRMRAWELASAISNWIFFVTAIASLVAAFLAPWIVRNLLAPGFGDDPAKEQLTISLLRLMLPSATIFGLSGLVMGILNSHQIFLFPALAPAMYQLGLVGGILFLSPRIGIYGLGWGVLIGASLHLLLQIPACLRLNGSYSFSLGLKSADVREVVRLMGPRLLGVAVVQINFWVNTRLASQFVEGSVTGIVLGFALMLMPQAAIAQSIAIAALPIFSAQVAKGHLDEMRHSLAVSLRGALLLSLPASLGLVVLRKPIIQLLYQRGQFDERSTELVAWALLWFGVGLVGHALVEIIGRAFYSLHDTKTPVMIGIGAMSLNVIFSFGFSALFIRLHWMPHGGLALANTVATGLEALTLFFLMRKRLLGLEEHLILGGIAKAMIASFFMGVGLLLWQSAAKEYPLWLIVFGGIFLGTGLFGLACYILRVREIYRIVDILKKRFQK